MALLSDTDSDQTPRSTLCCDSTVEAYKHSDPEKKGKKERREIKDRTGRSGFHVNNQCKHGSKRGNKSIQVSLSPAALCRAGFEPCDERRLYQLTQCSHHSTSLQKLASWRAMALLSDTDSDPTPSSGVCFPAWIRVLY